MNNNKKYFVPKIADLTLGVKYEQHINGRWISCIVDIELYTILHKRGGDLKNFTLRMERPKDVVEAVKHTIKTKTIRIKRTEEWKY